MPTFTPTTYGMPIPDEKHDHVSLWRHYGLPIQTGYSVIISEGVATPAPGVISPPIRDITGNAAVPNATETHVGADAGSGEGGLAWFRGGISYTITSAEETILVAAGYGSEIT